MFALCLCLYEGRLWHGYTQGCTEPTASQPGAGQRSLVWSCKLVEVPPGAGMGMGHGHNVPPAPAHPLLH